MSDSLIELAYQLTRAGQPFVQATVVWCERPTSAKPGAQAIIQADGQLTGWVGGSCTQPIVLREAKRILRAGGEPILLRLGAPEPDHAHSDPGVRVFPMTCASGGALDIYMEPHLPLPQLLLIGASPINAALQQLAPVVDFAVKCVDDSSLQQIIINERTFIVIATHGQYDENVLEHALVSPAVYVGMVSSSRRAEACRSYLRESGLCEEQIARLRAPAGLDLGARSPAEIAASILAELVQVRRHSPLFGGASGENSTSKPTERDELIQSPDQTATTDATNSSSSEAVPTEAIDPVCGMSVEIAGVRHTSVYNGRTFYFCCPACKREFAREPERFLVGNGL